MKKNKLQIEHLEKRIKPFIQAESVTRPKIGWIKTIRTTLGMSLEQLSKKLGRNKSSVARMEIRESNGGITIRTMEEVGRAMGMKLIYGFVPYDGSIEELIEKRAKNLATEIVMRTSGNMKLEDQENSPERIRKAIEERTKEIMEEMPKKLWD
ncbi:MAG: mobile mystery protein A [Bacteroidetes bacterium]|nr:mobile mystery protein A [Bacteroidota bacterium]